MSVKTGQWSAEGARKWFDTIPLPLGCNFIPSTAINQLDMWQNDTFDRATIKRELGWASSIGLNTIRVYLHDLLWEGDRDGFLARINDLLVISSSLGIKPIFVFFDDCWNPEPKLGLQPAPKPGVHNSGWLQSPSAAAKDDLAQLPRLKRYVLGVLDAFGRDERILLWDLYNEPGGNKRDAKSLPLLQSAFEWARAAKPVQPITAGLWYVNEALNRFQIENSDVVTFHNYKDKSDLKAQIVALKKHGRPLICTEFMSRKTGSTFENCLPVFLAERTGCCCWGLVSGKTQTIFPWGSPEGAPEPEPWFHDIFRTDGKAYAAAEITCIREHAAVGR